jgi:hypothetical protein
MKQELEIYDEDGFIALVDADKYHTFVDRDWEFDQLMDHFVTEMNKDTFIIWQTYPGGGLWKVRITDQAGDQKAFREFEKTINVTAGRLYLTNYTDLTMAAQFESDKIPANKAEHLFVELPNGSYTVWVRQLFDEETYGKEENDEKEAEVTHEIVIHKTTTASIRAEKVFGWEG